MSRDASVLSECVLVLSGYGLRLAIDRGHLVANDGIGGERWQARFSRSIRSSGCW